MVQELKIIMSGKFNSMVKVYIDDHPIGLIQDIKFHASSSEDFPTVEIVFPDLFDPKIDPSYAENGGTVEKLRKTLDALKAMPHVKVSLVPIEWDKQ